MNILIIGLGYAGLRFQRAFEHLASRYPLKLAYCSRRQKNSSLPYYPHLKEALRELKPEIVVVCANDIQHANVLAELADYNGFILCEKPLLVPGDNLPGLAAGLKAANGFALDLVERYSEATALLKAMVQQHHWRLLRASFHWGKDRLNDYRPTCGVVSEVIHALDLVSWISPQAQPMQLHHAIGIDSDFSISGDRVQDTVMFSASLGDAAVAGYASFVNIHRQRTLDFSFAAPNGAIIHARLEFDEPQWDVDRLRVWTRDASGALIELQQRLYTGSDDPTLATITKLSRLCEDVMGHVAENRPPRQPFAGLETSVQLQTLLNDIHARSLSTAPVRYIVNGERTLIPENADLESLG